MSLAFVLESFRFYRLRSRQTVQVLFVLGFLLNIAALMLPVGDRDFSRLINWAMNLGRQLKPVAEQSALLPDPRATSILTAGNVVFLVFSLFMSVLNIGLSLVYASAMNASFDDYPLRKGVKQFLSRIPALLLFALLLVPVYVLSLMFFGLPFMVVGSALAFTPMFLIDRRFNLSKALDESLSQTAGIRFQMVLSYIFVVFLLSGPSGLLSAWFGGSGWSEALIAAFFASIQSLVLGRLYALYYLYYSRSYPSRRMHNPYNPHDPTTFFKEVNRRGEDEDEEEAEEDEQDEEDDDDLW